MGDALIVPRAVAEERRTNEAEESLRPWRSISALIALVQQGAMVAVFAFVFLSGESYRAWAYSAAGAVVLLELAQWAIAREALERNPSYSVEHLYNAQPLDQRQRQFVTFAVALAVIAPILLIAMVPARSFEDEVVVPAVLVAVAVAPGLLALYRVRRHNSWLAVSRLPGRVKTCPH